MSTSYILWADTGWLCPPHAAGAARSDSDGGSHESLACREVVGSLTCLLCSSGSRKGGSVKPPTSNTFEPWGYMPDACWTNRTKISGCCSVIRLGQHPVPEERAKGLTSVSPSDPSIPRRIVQSFGLEE
ncbi:transcription elongation complex subunit [Aspergillus luchuensis]|uniref:Transcription elongation complex subunit n=1 Tax=Aspergillus kawachii TaxID=1069201 RepID=A0A146F4X8_ASPKA|nr:transcription elongation complex subunit [Aspergillus luchuensis]